MNTALTLDTNKKEIKALKWKLWSNTIISLLLIFCELGASYIFYQNNLFGLPQILTLGALVPTLFLLGNNLYLIRKFNQYAKA